MGVKGLTSYVSQYLSGKPVNICKELNATEEKQAQPSRPILVDGSGLSFYLYEESNLDKTFGGEFGALYDQTVKFVSQFQRWHIPLIVVFDGILETAKVPTRLQRRETDLSRVQDLVQRAVSAPAPAAGTYTRSHTFTQSRVLLPKMAEDVIRQALKDCKVITRRVDRENDDAMAFMANQTNAYAVLAEDSDFFILDTPGYIPFSSLRFSDDGAILGTRYSTKALAESLRVPKCFLPVISAIAGNDFVSDADVEAMKRVIANRVTVRKTSHVFESISKLLHPFAKHTCSNDMKCVEHVLLSVFGRGFTQNPLAVRLRSASDKYILSSFRDNPGGTQPPAAAATATAFRRTAKQSETVPAPLLSAFRANQVSNMFMSAYIDQQVWLPVNVANFCSSFDTNSVIATFRKRVYQFLMSCPHFIAALTAPHPATPSSAAAAAPAVPAAIPEAAAVTENGCRVDFNSLWYDLEARDIKVPLTPKMAPSFTDLWGSNDMPAHQLRLNAFATAWGLTPTELQALVPQDQIKHALFLLTLKISMQTIAAAEFPEQCSKTVKSLIPSQRVLCCALQAILAQYAAEYTTRTTANKGPVPPKPEEKFSWPVSTPGPLNYVLSGLLPAETFLFCLRVMTHANTVFRYPFPEAFLASAYNGQAYQSLLTGYLSSAPTALSAPAQSLFDTLARLVGLDKMIAECPKEEEVKEEPVVEPVPSPAPAAAAPAEPENEKEQEAAPTNPAATPAPAPAASSKKDKKTKASEQKADGSGSPRAVLNQFAGLDLDEEPVSSWADVEDDEPAEPEPEEEEEEAPEEEEAESEAKPAEDDEFAEFADEKPKKKAAPAKKASKARKPPAKVVAAAAAAAAKPAPKPAAKPVVKSAAPAPAPAPEPAAAEPAAEDDGEWMTAPSSKNSKRNKRR